MNQYIQQYQKSSIETASREKILIMLYDGAIQFLNKAKIALKNNNIEESHNNIMGAENIIQEFINSMDREVAPQLAENLISLYEYFLRRLTQANMKKDAEPIDEVLKYLKGLKETWEKAIILAQKEQMAAANHNDDEEEYYDYEEEEDEE